MIEGARRTLRPTAVGEVVLVDDQELEPFLGTPFKPVHHRRAKRFVDPGLDQDDEVALRHRPVMDIGRLADIQQAEGFQAAIRGNAVDTDIPAVDREVPDRAVRLPLGMGEERHPRQIIAPGFHAPGLERGRVQGDGRAAFPEGIEFAVDHDHGRVGRVDVIGAGHRKVRMSHRAEPRGHELAVGLLDPALVGLHEAAGMDGLAVGNRNALDHAVAVKPMAGEVVLAIPELRRPVAVEGAFEAFRHLAEHQPHRCRIKPACRRGGVAEVPVGHRRGARKGGRQAKTENGGTGSAGGQEVAAGQGHVGLLKSKSDKAQLTEMTWTAPSSVTSNRASSHLAGPNRPMALFENAKGSVGMPNGLLFISPSPFTS